MNAVLAMRVELTFSNGMKQVMQADKVLFIKDCAWHGCRQEFKTEYPNHDYCSNKCGKDAANFRAKAKP